MFLQTTLNNCPMKTCRRGFKTGNIHVCMSGHAAHICWYRQYEDVNYGHFLLG